MLKRFISVKTQVEFIHCWPQAPEAVKFLRDPHRHMLHIQLTTEVNHNDREIEFIMLKRSLDSILKLMIVELPINASCEMVGVELMNWLHNNYGTRATSIEVFEDGENGAIIKWEKETE